jgi:acetyl/propionyl-CoA carboxylase alpha subunit
MLGKLIVHAEDRGQSIDKMVWALSNYVALGVKTNIEFLIDILKNEAFREGRTTTHFIEEHFKTTGPPIVRVPLEVLVAAGIYDHLFAKAKKTGTEEVVIEGDPHSPWKKGGPWRIGR